MKVVWSESEPNEASGNASLLKSLSVLIETEEDEICAEVEKNAETERNEINESIAVENETDLGNEKNVNNNEIDENDGIKIFPENDQSEQNTGENEETSQPQSLGAERNEQSLPNLTTSNENGKKKNVFKVEIPPIWAPVDQRTNSALVYLYFRSVRKTN